MSAPATLLLIHGCGNSGAIWDDVAAHLGDFPVVAPSLPGRGPAGAPPLTSAADNARWLFEYLADRSITDVICAGHSFGGGVAIEMALQRRAGPVAVRGLGLVSTGARLRVSAEILDAVARAAAIDVPVDLERFLYHPGADRALVDRVEAQSRQTPTATTRQDWWSTNNFDRLGQLGAIDVPAAAVTGAEDRLTPPKYARYLAEHIAGATLDIIDGAGHMIHVERPAELAAVLDRLAGRVAAARPAT